MRRFVVKQGHGERGRCRGRREKPMNIRLSATFVAVAAAFPFATSALAADDASGETIIVSATRIDTADVAATYASEVHRRKDIERSGATTLVDYLARQTSVQLTPYFGNRFTPSVNMRGYGSSDGHQNVVISLDGRRLNNIDSVPQLLGAIPLADIDRIEIAKGSGSVIYGDGATAGTIQIYTRPRTGASIDLYGGNHGAIGATANAGLVRDRFSVSATADHSEHDGFSDKDPSGHRDESTADNWRVALSGKPADALKLNFDAGSSRIDTRYPNSLTLAQFRDDPAQNTGRNYTHQRFDSDYWGVGADYDLTRAWRLSVRHHDEAKMSEFVAFVFKSDYRYLSDELALQYLGDALSVTAGVQSFDGEREDSGSETSKRNVGWFVQGQYEVGRLTLSAGARRERVEYEFEPDSGARLKADDRLTSWDLGANYRIDDALSLFGNYNRSFQAPDIDRFFVPIFDSNFSVIGMDFNGFIEPAKVRTVTLGLNHVVPANRLKLAVFHADLENEIFFEPFTFTNTNLDESHKYGLELQDSWYITPQLTGLVNYTWTRAIIDRDDAGGGAFEGKELPGVPRHNVVVGLNLQVGDGNLHLSHSWRSKAWAANDFNNNNAQKQREYQSTDLAYRHRIRDLELYAAVSNLFEYENGVWVGDNQIYPVDFSRTWKVGAKLSF
jgi:iron complex outermembrane receptor protein